MRERTMLSTFQQQLHDAVLNGDTHHNFGCVGRRGGKTHLAGDLAKHWVRETGKSLVYSAPTLDNATSFREYSGLRDRWICHPSVLREHWADLVILDEYQYFPDTIYRDLIRDRMAFTKVLFLFTPRSNRQERTDDHNPHHAEDLLLALQGQPEMDEWDKAWREMMGIRALPDDVAFTHWPSAGNPTLPIGLFQRLHGQMSEDVYRKEVEAQLGG